MKRIFSLLLLAIAAVGLSIVAISCDDDAVASLGYITKYIESGDIVFQSGGEFLGRPAGTLTMLDPDIRYEAAVLAYVRIGVEDKWYALPYSWASGSYSDYLTFVHGEGQITFYSFSNTGETIPSTLNRIKYIIVYDQESRLMNGIDINDHSAVLEYLGIKD